MQQPFYSIVQVTDQLNVGGTEQIIVMLANLLQAHGHSTTVVTTVAPGTLANKLNPTVQLINLNRLWKWNPVTMYRLVKELRKFDIVHVHSSYNLRYVYLSSRLFFLRKPIFYHEHYGDINIDSTVTWHQKWIYPNVYFIAVSNQLAEWASNTIKVSSKRVFLLQNTIAKQDIGYATILLKPYQLLLVSNIRRTKNIEFAIELVKALNDSSVISYHLTIIGQVNDEDYYQEIQQLINNHSLTKHIHFNHDCNNIQPLLHSYHMALHTSKSETGPLVLIEYLAQGLPFITYNTGEVVQQIQPHVPECIMQDYNIVEWLQAIRTTIALRVQVASHLTELYDRYFSLEAYYKQCIAIYKEGLK